MPLLREDLLNPIEGDNPAGANLRYDPVYDKIKEARREEEDLAQGVWEHERKVADLPLVIKLTQETIATRSKDLQLAAWLTEASLRKDGFAGLVECLDFVRGLVDKFWDNLYPEIEDGDMEMRVAPLDWIGSRLEDDLKNSPLARDGYGWYKYNESRTVGYEASTQSDQARKVRDKQIKAGKLAPEEFDKSFQETPKLFYLQAEKNLDACLALLKTLDKVCTEKFADQGPSFSRMENALGEVRHLVHSLLEKKRETEPDPVEEVPQEAAPAGGEEGGEPAAAGSEARPGSLVLALAPSEPADRLAAVEAIAGAAAQLRKREPASPAPYLLMRGLRWGELRAAMEANDLRRLEAPPTELRQHVKMLALQNKWQQLLDAAENAMSLPCSRAWLDLQRMVVEACAALGPDYDLIAKSIRSELRVLLRDLPQLLQATLLDDTPVANQETQTWLRELMAEPAATDSPSPVPAEPPLPSQGEAGWKRAFVDSFQLASEALRNGQEAQAIEILHGEIERQRSGRGRFLRKLQLVELCVSSGKEAIAQPILDDLIAAIDAHKLEEWEDRDLTAGALVTIMKASAKIKADPKEKQKLFDRVCRLSPARALEV